MYQRLITYDQKGEMGGFKPTISPMPTQWAWRGLARASEQGGVRSLRRTEANAVSVARACPSKRARRSAEPATHRGQRSERSEQGGVRSLRRTEANAVSVASKAECGACDAQSLPLEKKFKKYTTGFKRTKRVHSSDLTEKIHSFVDCSYYVIWWHKLL